MSLVLFFISYGSLPTQFLFVYNKSPLCRLGAPTTVKAALINRPLQSSAVLLFLVKLLARIWSKVTHATYFQGTLISIQMWPLTPTKEFSVLYSLLLCCQHFPLLVHMKGHGFDLVNFLGLSLPELEVAHLDFKYTSSLLHPYDSTPINCL